MPVSSNNENEDMAEIKASSRTRDALIQMRVVEATDVEDANWTPPHQFRTLPEVVMKWTL